MTKEKNKCNEKIDKLKFFIKSKLRKSNLNSKNGPEGI